MHFMEYDISFLCLHELATESSSGSLSKSDIILNERYIYAYFLSRHSHVTRISGHSSRTPSLKHEQVGPN